MARGWAQARCRRAAVVRSKWRPRRSSTQTPRPPISLPILSEVAPRALTSLWAQAARGSSTSERWISPKRWCSATPQGRTMGHVADGQEKVWEALKWARKPAARLSLAPNRPAPSPYGSRCESDPACNERASGLPQFATLLAPGALDAREAVDTRWYGRGTGVRGEKRSRRTSPPTSLSPSGGRASGAYLSFPGSEGHRRRSGSGCPRRRCPSWASATRTRCGSGRNVRCHANYGSFHELDL